jgi:hypothetical protein
MTESRWDSLTRSNAFQLERREEVRENRAAYSFGFGGLGLAFLAFGFGAGLEGDSIGGWGKASFL